MLSRFLVPPRLTAKAVVTWDGGSSPYRPTSIRPFMFG